MVDTTKKLITSLESNGCKAVQIPISRVDEAVCEMHAIFHSGQLNQDFTKSYGARFQPDWLSHYPGARSVILVAVPEPMLLLKCTYRNRSLELILPPIYAYTKSKITVKNIAEEILQSAGHRFQWLEGAPCKLIAVRSGLCQYGRMNITFCEGLGSYIQFYGIVTDLEAPEDAAWLPVSRMSECEHCKACLNACPTHCIDPDEIIIHAEHCLTCLNENGGDFPDWLELSAHNALVGCMACQRACPKNRSHLKTVTVENAFDEDDIGSILAGGAFCELPEKTQEAIRALNLDDYWAGNAISRNLRTLLQQQYTLID